MECGTCLGLCAYTASARRSATTSTPLTGEENSIDRLVTVTSVKGWDVSGRKFRTVQKQEKWASVRI